MVRAAVIGKDGRTTALRRTLQASPRISGDVPCLSEWRGPSSDTKATRLQGFRRGWVRLFLWWRTRCCR
jgi:hypothetical protein